MGCCNHDLDKHPLGTNSAPFFPFPWLSHRTLVRIHCAVNCPPRPLPSLLLLLTGAGSRYFPQEAAALQGRLGGSVSVEVDSAPGVDLVKTLAEIRDQYEDVIERNRREAAAWHKEQVGASQQQATRRSVPSLWRMVCSATAHLWHMVMFLHHAGGLVAGGCIDPRVTHLHGPGVSLHPIPERMQNVP